MRILIVLAMLVAWIPPAFAEEEKLTSEWTTPATTSPPGAMVSIVSPTDGEVVPLTFLVKFMVSGMGIAPAGSKIDNTGHHHLLIDIDEMPSMDQPLPATDQILHFGGGQTETELTLAPGEHSLQLVFGDYAHRPHDPPVISDKIVIRVSSAEAVMPQDEE
jgi:hypothetical protein